MGITVPVIILTGAMGVGKTSVLWEAHDVLSTAKVPHAAIDYDFLSIYYPPQRDGHTDDLAIENLAASWSNFAKAGAGRLLIACLIEDGRDLDRFR